MDAKAEKIALFRYGLIAPLVLEALPRGELTRRAGEIAARQYEIPGSQQTSAPAAQSGRSGTRRFSLPSIHSDDLHSQSIRSRGQPSPCKCCVFQLRRTVPPAAARRRGRPE